jgi:hypothetical protein
MIEQKDLAGSFTCTERGNTLKVIRYLQKEPRNE